jgi:hypothetical protein
MYTFEVLWVPGKTHLIADALSWAPVFPAEPDLDIVMCARVSATNPQYKIIADGTDAAHQLLLEAVSASKTLPPILSPFQEVFSELRVEDGLLLVGYRLVVREGQSWQLFMHPTPAMSRPWSWPARHSSGRGWPMKSASLSPDAPHALECWQARRRSRWPP